MFHPSPIRLLLLLTCVAANYATADTNAALHAKQVYDRSVLPILKTYCYDCHGEDSDRGDLSLDVYDSYRDLIADQATWHKVAQYVTSHLMPPNGKPMPSLDQRRVLVDWIDNAVFYVDPEDRDPGPTVVRRMNRIEYANTVRDVFRVTTDLNDLFPPDDTGYGYDKVGEVLTLSPLLIEKYMAAAERVVAEATTLHRTARVHTEVRMNQIQTLSGERREVGGSVVLEQAGDEVGVDVTVPTEGFYRVLIRAAGKSADGSPAVMSLRCADRELGRVPITTRWRGGGSWYRHTMQLMRLPAGRHQLRIRIAKPEGDRPLPVIAVGRVGLAGPMMPTALRNSPFLEWLSGQPETTRRSLYLSGESFMQGQGRWGLDTGKAHLSTNGYTYTPIHIPESGRYRIRVKAGAQQAGDEHVRFAVRVKRPTTLSPPKREEVVDTSPQVRGEVELATFAIAAASQRSRWYEREVDLVAGNQDLRIWFLNQGTDPKSNAQRRLWIHEVELERVGSQGVWPQAEQLPALIDRVGRRLLRRSLTDDESAKLDRMTQHAISLGESPIDALRVAMTAMLSSAKFIFLNAPIASDAVSEGVAFTDEISLAVRLSYFLWSGTPDAELLALAAEGALRKDLANQVRRMLQDERSNAFVEGFAGQWLRLRDMDLVKPDGRKFADVDRDVIAAMRRESELFFTHVLRENRSVMEFINGDYTFINPTLAKHYGLKPGDDSADFRKVALAGRHGRAGILTHGSILTLTSHPTMTSPVNRGKFILEQVLGTPAPPAPNAVPPLEVSAVDESNMTLRQIFEKHRSDKRCAACHAFLDPMGMALEHYDAVGRFRQSEAGRPIDASGQLITGEQFKDFVELRTILVRDRTDDFLQTLAKNLLTYAIGRGVTYRDKHTIRRIVQNARDAGLGFQDMLIAVCESDPFQLMRKDNP